ncbi:MAG: magnesium transporter CorA [Oscillibacter sp.]|nr:magnesium transporter CorA [Oscillibacter sp.]
MLYLIKHTIQPCMEAELRQGRWQYVAVLTPEEWQEKKDSFDMGIDLELDIHDIYNTKAEVNYDSLTGKFLIPDRNNLDAHGTRFAFALDEKGIVFIDPSGAVRGMIAEIAKTRRWRIPSLERFLYDFLARIVQQDMPILEGYDLELDQIEDAVQAGDTDADLVRVNEIRGNIRELVIHYEQLLDLGQELEENENGFFRPENVRYFRMFMNRVARLRDTAASLRDHAMQVRDLHHAQLEAKQNKTMSVLTVVTTVFMPLTLIAGWYGMNFRYMPELESPFGYPVVIGVSVLIVVGSFALFRKLKLL